MARPLSQLVVVQRPPKRTRERTGFVAYVTCFINKQKAQKIGTKLPANPCQRTRNWGAVCPGAWAGTSFCSHVLLTLSGVKVSPVEKLHWQFGTFAYELVIVSAKHLCNCRWDCTACPFAFAFATSIIQKSRPAALSLAQDIRTSGISARTALNETSQGQESFLITRHTHTQPHRSPL